jgi:hypothetical protein
VLPTILQIAPEIAYSKDEIPENDHCLDDLPSEPQTALVNSLVANAMIHLYKDKVLDWDGSKKRVNEIRINTAEERMMTGFYREPII